MNENILTQLFAKIDKTDSCWIWTGGKQMKLRIGNTSKSVKHLLYGEIPFGHVMINTCDKSMCVNPDHLTITQRGNHVPRRKPIDRENPYPIASNFPEEESSASDKVIYELTDKQIKNFFKKVNK